MIEDGKIEFNKKYENLTKAFNDCISAYMSNISKYDRKALQHLKETYNAAIKYLSDGFNILEKSVDYSDSFCSNVIHALATDRDNFIILEENG